MRQRDETIDIYDEQMVKIGTGSRNEAHRTGQWHKTFQCWVVGRPAGVYSVLLQKRHESKQIFPKKLDKSAAGHLLAGETVEDGIREMEEELGIRVPFAALTPCGIVPLETYTSDGSIDREFCHIFLYACDLPLDAFSVGLGEVSGLFWIALTDYYHLVRGQQRTAHTHGFVVLDDGRRKEREQTIVLDDLTPQSEAYYDLLFAAFRQQGWLDEI